MSWRKKKIGGVMTGQKLTLLHFREQYGLNIWDLAEMANRCQRAVCIFPVDSSMVRPTVRSTVPLHEPGAYTQQRRDLSAAWYQFRLPGRGAWLSYVFKDKSSVAERIEVGAEGAVIFTDAAAYPVRILRGPVAFVEIAGNDSADRMFRVWKGSPASMWCLKAGMRDHKSKPATRLENSAHGLNGCLEIRNVGERHDADAAGKAAIAQWQGVLGIPFDVLNAQWLLLLIAASQA